jgi:probable rRNA maturation factor
MPETLAVSVSVHAGGAKARTAARGLDRWLSQVAPAKTRGHVGIAILSDRRIQSLNRQYRRKNTATDVLSFPVEERARPAASMPEDGYWGDIAIAAGVAARQARAEGHSLAVELRVLALHGLLHLLGYDHEVDKGRMARVEDRLRKRGGLPAAGLVARADRLAKAASKTRR